MLPTTYTETAQEASKRQANFLALRTIEPFVDAALFQQLLSEVNSNLAFTLQAQKKMDFPSRIDWKGEVKPLTFEEVKINFGHIDQNYLPQLLQNFEDGATATNLKKSHSLSFRSQAFNKVQLGQAGVKNMMLMRRNFHLTNFAGDQKKNFQLYEVSRFERMKTIYCHALIEEGYNAPIYNVFFDQTGQFIISGADDGQDLSFIYVRIIKIFDKETMNLQASLHSHNEVITDMDISKCNNYLATASKDGKLIIWDWKNCQKLDEIKAHASDINNLKFFQLKLKSQNTQQRTEEKIQILVSCSEDGTIKIYDEMTFSNAQAQTGNQQPNMRRPRRGEVPPVKKDRFCLVLTPDDFRPVPGSRNKKINAISVSQSGLVAAGTSSGEIFLWKLDILKLKQQHQKAFAWLGSSKKHQKRVHHCEFSPNGKLLFTGSIDGTAKVWNVDFERSKKNSDQGFGLTDNRLLAILEQKKLYGSEDQQYMYRDRFGVYKALHGNSWQCDTLSWSCSGRFAIASLSGKVDFNHNVEEWSVIKIWDSQSNQVIEDICQENNIRLKCYSFVISTHPKIEEIFMSGSEGGQICIWNIKTRQLIKKFLEYGIYSFEKYTMSNPIDGRFSPTGDSFIIGSELGTLSLFSSDCADFKYQATRVEQFYEKDDQKHLFNLYYDFEEEPQICGYNLIPHEVQPPSSLIGKFQNARRYTNEEYERNLLIRRELAIEEEKFLQSQLEEGQRNDFFNQPNEQVLVYDQNDGEEVKENQMRQLGRREIIPAQNNLPQRRGRGRPPRRQQQQRAEPQVVQPINPYFDPDNSFFDRASDENFVEPEENEVSEDSDDDVDNFEEESEEFRIKTRNETRQEQSRRHENRSAMRNRAENDRTARALRRQQRNAFEDRSEDEDFNRGRRSKRKCIINSGETTPLDFEDDEDFSMQEVEVPKRRLRRNNEISDNDAHDDEEEKYETRTRRGQKEKEKEVKAKSNQRILRNRDSKKNYEGMDSDDGDYSFSDEQEDDEEEKNGSSNYRQKSSNEEKTSKRGKKVSSDEEYDDEMVDQDVVLPSEKRKMKGDEDFDLVVEETDYAEGVINKCYFCARKDPPILGPFIRVNNVNRSKPNEKYYFHKDCIEVNNYSFFSTAKQKWLNIGKAIEQFQKRSHMCTRCLQKGATIHCDSCKKYYHGHLCSQLYMIMTGERQFQCLSCRNAANYESMLGRELIEKQELKLMKRTIPRQHLLKTKQTLTQYIPQVNDLVYYFYQGHEEFISFYNCFFYAGDSDQIKVTYPWKIYDELQFPTLCRIKSISHSFPSKNMLVLLKRYGKSQQIEQTSQVITHLEMFLFDEPDKKFSLDFFPNKLNDFLVPKGVYEQSMQQFTELMQQNKFVGQEFRSRTRDYTKVAIVGIQEKESSLPETGWKNILFKHVDNQRFRDRARRGRDNNDNEPPEQMNVWELQLCNLTQSDDEALNLSTIVNDEEITAIFNFIQDYCQNKKEQTQPFKERVTEDIARDYKDHVVAEMYISLISQRLLSKYYRSCEQMFADLDQIYLNAKIYNGEDHPLTKDAKKLADSIKNEIKRVVNFSQDDYKKKKNEEQKHSFNQFHQKPTGKLTAPSIRHNNHTSMDFFKSNITARQNQYEENKNDIQNSRSLRRLKENDNPFLVKIQASITESDDKITPKSTSLYQMEESSKRTTRNSNLIQIKSENHLEKSAKFSTGEKTSSKHGSARMADEIDEGFNIGKRTRSGRQARLARPNLNEDDIEKEVFNQIEEEEKSQMQPFSAKRIRQI